VPAIPDPWWQTRFGDILAYTNVDNLNMPAAASLSESDGNRDEGVLLYGGSVSLGSGTITNLVQTAYAGTEENYTYFWNLLEMPTSGAVDDWTFYSWVAGDEPSGVGVNGAKHDQTFYTTNLTIGTGWSVPDGEKWIIFVNGTLTLNANISIPGNGFVMFIVSGEININAGADSVAGIYVANGTITVASDNQVFNGIGSFIGWTGVTMERDIQAATPSEVFEYDQNLILNAPEALKKANFVWSEVAP
jgi:formylmethanofuran dehydrogenase subunit C